MARRWRACISRQPRWRAPRLLWRGLRAPGLPAASRPQPGGLLGRARPRRRRQRMVARRRGRILPTRRRRRRRAASRRRLRKRRPSRRRVPPSGRQAAKRAPLAPLAGPAARRLRAWARRTARPPAGSDVPLCLRTWFPSLRASACGTARLRARVACTRWYCAWATSTSTGSSWAATRAAWRCSSPSRPACATTRGLRRTRRCAAT